MLYKTIEEVRTEAEVFDPTRMSKREKLERWAVALEAKGEARLKTLTNVEYALPTHRAPMREDNSPLSIAASDPVLRAAGLKDDTYGEAMRFFDLGHGAMHKVVCRCHLGSYVGADRMAQRIRRMAAGPFAGIRAAFSGMAGTVRARFA
jgi:hypothetical protein